jgi:hypothetical protein
MGGYARSSPRAVAASLSTQRTAGRPERAGEGPNRWHSHSREGIVRAAADRWEQRVRLVAHALVGLGLLDLDRQANASSRGDVTLISVERLFGDLLGGGG